MKKHNTKKANKKRITTQGRQKGNQFLKYCGYGFGALLFTGAIFGDADEEEAKKNIAEPQPVEQEESPKQTPNEPVKTETETVDKDRFTADENQMYISALKQKADDWSGFPNWGFEAQRDKWVAKGREICDRADNGTPIMSQFEDAKREGDKKTLLSLWGASNILCTEHNSSATMIKVSNHNDSL